MALEIFAEWPRSYIVFIFGILVGWYLTSATVTWYRLRHIPGPFLARFSYHWLAKVARSTRQHQIYRDLCNQYGPLVRVGPNELTTDDPEVLRNMASVRSDYGRDTWYKGGRANPHHDNVFTLLDQTVHRERKAKIVGGFAGREAPLIETGVDEQVLALIRVIRDNYIWSRGRDQGKVLDLSPLTSYFTMDAISKVAFGQEFGFLAANDDLYGFLGEVRDNWPRLAMAVDVPYFRDFVFSSAFLNWFGAKETDKKGMGKCMKVAKERVEERFAADAKNERDLLGYWIRNGMTMTECEVDGLFFIIAGSDTTASVIRITMLYLMTCPQVYRKLKDEIGAAIREGKASFPIQQDEAKKLPYLQAVVYEGLRQRPPAPGLYPKAVPPEGDTIHGKFIPGGTAIGMNTSSLFASKKHFGVDADVFRPERFTEASEDDRQEMERLVELCFGHGRYMCAGKPVAFMELNKVFFELLRAFDFQLINPTNPWKSRSYSVFVEENMWVKVTESEVAA
ncbi:hypothetical protein KJ359_010549 [Pestalotiopsis sp. 9143b]|nr:hypothetical protein KJ359_010549 [Pestalotiopsis sp. 9143b]